MTKRSAKPPAMVKPTIVRAPLAQSSRATLQPAPKSYAEWTRDLKNRVHDAHQRAARAVNSELVGLYWRLGQDIRARQQRQCRGAKIVDLILTEAQRNSGALGRGARGQ